MSFFDTVSVYNKGVSFVDTLGIVKYHYGYGELNMEQKIAEELFNYLFIGEETSLTDLLNTHYPDKTFSHWEMMEIHRKLKNFSKSKGKLLDFSKWDGKCVGMPYNLKFVVKEVKNGNN